jgi:protease-4
MVRSVSSTFTGGTTFASSNPGGLRETVIEPASTRHKVALIEIQGVISSAPMDFHGNNLVSYIEDQLSRAGDDPLVKAVVLKIDSPGGEVLASDEIYQSISEFQETFEKPVVVSMGTVAASGGYYVAAPARWIVANELTITGSIGVIMQTYNWRALMDKVGVEPMVFKSGALKDMLSPNKREEDITPEERRIVQDLVDASYERFRIAIDEGRGLALARNQDNEGAPGDQGRPLADAWTEFADGRLLSGRDAWNLGLIDEMGDFATAFQRALRLADIPEARLIQYQRPPTFGSLFQLFGQGATTKVELDLGIRLPQLRSGLYFLAPQLVH